MEFTEELISIDLMEFTDDKIGREEKEIHLFKEKKQTILFLTI